MTTTTYSPAPSLANAHGVTFGGILRSEWIKLRTLRSTIWCFAVILVVTVALTFLLAGTIDLGTRSVPHAIVQEYALRTATLSIGFTALIASVLGALVITGEYGTGMIRSTLTAVPRRTPALIGKAIVLGISGFVVGAVSLAIASAIAFGVMGARGFDVDAGDGAYWLGVLGGAGYLALIGVLAFTLGAIIRSTAGAIATAMGLILVLPTIISIFGAVTKAAWASNIAAFLPSNAGSAMFSYTGGTPPQVADGVIVLEPWQGALVLLAWIVVLGATAAALLKRRDA